MPIFPNVPIAPGVPPVPRDPFAQAASVAFLTADAIGTILRFFTVSWGIFLDGQPVILPDTVATVEYKQGSVISDYPVEQGAFQSYDKVATPYEAMVRMAVGGSVAAKQVFLGEIAAAAATLDLYDIVTPEAIYRSANIVHYDYRRSAHEGLGLLVVDIRLVEVRVTATAQFTNTKAPSANDPSFVGPVQPVAATPAQANTAPLVQ